MEVCTKGGDVWLWISCMHSEHPAWRLMDYCLGLGVSYPQL